MSAATLTRYPVHRYESGLLTPTDGPRKGDFLFADGEAVFHPIGWPHSFDLVFQPFVHFLPDLMCIEMAEAPQAGHTRDTLILEAT